jgi:hypothetical protein
MITLETSIYLSMLIQIITGIDGFSGFYFYQKVNYSI